MRIATFNVNSIRSRIDRVEALLKRHDIDVLAIQETKAREDQLPLMGLQSLGYEVAASGFNQWNGVAIISRVGVDDVQVGFPDMPGFGGAEKRADQDYTLAGYGQHLGGVQVGVAQAHAEVQGSGRGAHHGALAFLLGVALLASRFVLPRLFGWMSTSAEGLFIWSLTWCFGFVVAAEALHVSEAH